MISFYWSDSFGEGVIRPQFPFLRQAGFWAPLGQIREQSGHDKDRAARSGVFRFHGAWKPHIPAQLIGRLTDKSRIQMEN
jgi:hypothetical protein